MAWLIGFVFGVTLCAFMPALPDWRILLSITTIIGMGHAYIPKVAGSISRLCLATLVGLAYAAWHAEARMEQELSPAAELRPVTMVVVVRGLPARGTDGSRMLVDVERVETAGTPIPERLRLTAKNTEGWPAGSRWRVTARLRARHATANPYGFDAEQWMWAHGVLASGHLLGSGHRLDDACDPLAYIDRLRARIAGRVERVLGESRAAALITALTVGDQQGISRPDWQLFARTGVTHLVSISGLHIGMVAGMAALAARALLRRFPPRRVPIRLVVAVCGLCAAGAYALLAGWSVPTRRTFFMLLVAGALLLWRRALSPFQIWWLALSAVLLLDPFAVFLPGLWLSFGLVASLMLVVIGRRRPPGRWRVMWLGQWASTVMSIVPLSGFFSTLPLVSPLANLIAIPWVSILLAPLSLLAVVLPLDALLLLAAWLGNLFFLAIEWLARAPVLGLPGMPWPLMALALLGSLWLIAPPGLPGRGFGPLLLAPMFFYAPPRPVHGTVWISVLDVGQGLSVLIRTARHTLLYDTGALAADSVVLPQLGGLGVRRLDKLVLSHHDSDHDGAAVDTLRKVPAAEVLVGQMASASANGLRAVMCTPGHQWSWDGVRFEVLAPLAQIRASGNNPYSCVLRVATARHALLLTGDIPVSVESMLVARYGTRLASSVLLAPHHGSKTSSSAGFLQTVAPRWAIVSAGYRNRFGHPHASVLAQYRAVGAEVLRTDQAGALEIRLGQRVEIAGFRQATPRYWRPR